MIEVEEGYVNMQKDGDLRIFSYSHSCQYDQRWNIVTMMARGLVLDVVARKVIATPLCKFFNLSELDCALPDEPFQVQEKIDGSLIILFSYHNQWRAVTRGSFISEQAQWAQNYLETRIDTNCLIPGFTYCCEVIYAQNRIVVNYNHEGLYILTTMDEGGEEVVDPTFYHLLADCGFKLPQIYQFNSLAEIASKAETLTRNEEGFVVRFQNGLRVKIKGVEYIRIAKILAHIGPLAIWESLMNCDNMEATRSQLPEEMLADFDNIVSILKDKLAATVQNIQLFYEQTKTMTDKELGIAIQSGQFDKNDVGVKFVFACRKEGFLDDIQNQGRNRQRVFMTFRPTGNQLENYVPSTIMNRFQNENDT
jgi:RNA ligase